MPARAASRKYLLFVFSLWKEAKDTFYHAWAFDPDSQLSSHCSEGDNYVTEGSTLLESISLKAGIQIATSPALESLVTLLIGLPVTTTFRR